MQSINLLESVCSYIWECGVLVRGLTRFLCFFCGFWYFSEGPCPSLVGGTTYALIIYVQLPSSL